MEFKLTYKYQNSIRCKDGKRRNFILFFLNGELLLKQKRPFDSNMRRGYDSKWFFSNFYIHNNKLFQTRINGGKFRNVSYPLSVKVLKRLGVTKEDFIISNNCNTTIIREFKLNKILK